MRLRLTGVVLVVGIVLVFAGSGYLYPATWNYRITIEIETPEGLKAGSAVREVRMGKNFARFLNPDVGEAYFSVKGEAVVVDLGDRGILFALIKWDSFNEFFNAFPFNRGGFEDKVKFYNNIKVGEAVELKTDLPKFVMFTDRDNPMTVASVNNRKMNEVFGDGVKLKAITIERTNDPVMTGVVEKFLPWMHSIKSNIDGTSSTFSNKLSNTLHIGNFKRDQ